MLSTVNKTIKLKLTKIVKKNYLISKKKFQKKWPPKKFFKQFYKNLTTPAMDKCCIYMNKTRPCNLQQTINHDPEPNIRNKLSCYYPLKNFQNGGQVTLKKNSETENKYFLR